MKLEPLLKHLKCRNKRVPQYKRCEFQDQDLPFLVWSQSQQDRLFHTRLNYNPVAVHSFMICNHCHRDQSTTIDQEIICTHCGTVLGDNIDNFAFATTTTDQNDRRTVFRRANTRREQDFLNRLTKFANYLGLGASIRDISSLYYTHRDGLSTYRNRFSAEAALSLIYLATRSQRSGQTLADYAGRLGLTDVRKLNNAFKRLSYIIQMPAQEQAASTTHMSTIVGKLYEPLKSLMNVDADAVELTRQARRVYGMAQQAKLETGRHAYPLNAACIVVAACSLTKNDRAFNLVDWGVLGQHISYAPTTVFARYQELMKILFHYAKSLPWLAGVKITKVDVQRHLNDIIQICDTMPDSDIEGPSVSRHPPTYMRNMQRLAQRSEQISRASEYLESNDALDPLLLDVETRLIYFLLAKHVPESEIQEMSPQHIYERVRKLYTQEEHSLSPEELDDLELTERDMDDSELEQYLKPDVH